MKKRMARRLILAAALGVALAGGAYAQTWTGSGADEKWSTGGNWNPSAPANPATTLTFGTGGLTKTGVVDAATWTAGTLTFQNTSGQHVIDLGGNTLRLNTLLHANAYGSNLRIRNGRLVLRGEVRMNGANNMAASLRPDIELDMNAAVNMYDTNDGENNTRSASLDLRSVIVATNAFGRRVLTLNGLRVGTFGTERPHDGRIYLDGTTTINELRFTGNLHFGIHGKRARIGDATNWRLPDNLDLTFGQTSAIELYVGSYPGFQTYGRICAGTGGALRANTSGVVVGGGGGGNQTDGYLLLADMERIENFTCSGSISVGTAGSSGTTIGELSLPPGDASTVNLYAGSAYTGRGHVTLNGTRLAVSGATAVNANGIVSNRVGAASSGLELGASATLSVASGGKLVVVFTSATPVFGSPYYGFKWAGDRVATLEGYKADGRLVVNTNALGSLAGLVSIFATNGVTYVGIPDQGISVAASDKTTASTVLTDEATVSVTVSATDIGGQSVVSYAASQSVPADFGTLSWQAAGTFDYTITGGEGVATIYGWAKDGDGRIIGATTEIVYSTATPVITRRAGSDLAGTLRLALAFDTDVAAVGQVAYRVNGSAAPWQWTSVNLGKTHDIAVTGLVANTAYELYAHANAGSANAASNGPVVLTTTAPTTGGLTWSGACDADLRWGEGLNWSGNRPPTETTTATLIYGNTGVAKVGVVSAPTQQVGTIQFQNTSGQHTIDLGGNTLRLNTLLHANAYGSNLRVRNGQLVLRGEVRMNGANNMSASLRPDIELDMNAAVNMYDTNDGENNTRYASLDLRSVIVATNALGRRVLTLNGLRVGTFGTERPHDGRIYLDGTTTINELRFTGNIYFGIHGKRARIGDATNWRLPDNLDLTFGQTSAVQLYVGSYPAFQTYGRICAGTGGALRANTSGVVVGGGGGGNQTDGYLLLADMERIESFTCSGSISVGTAGSSGTTIGELSLPPGDASTVNLSVGSAYTGRGRVTLNGTRLAVSGATAVNANGIVSNRVGAASSGLELGAAATLSVSSGGKLVVVFTSATPVFGSPYYGFKWAGDRVATLEGYRADGRLVVNTNALGSLAGLVSIFATNGVTYVGIPDQGISVVAADKTTGSTLLTGSPNISVTVSATHIAGTPVVSYAASESVPADFDALSWGAAGTFDYTIAGGEGVVTIYGWAKDNTGRIIGATTETVYSTEPPVITLRPGDYRQGTLRVILAFDTDLPSVGQVAYRLNGSADAWQWTAQSLGTTHDIAVTGLVADTAYELYAYANAGLANAASNGPVVLTTTAPTTGGLTWSGAGDPDLRWGEGLNWSGNRPPTETTTATLVYGNTGVAKMGVVSAPTQQVGTIQFENTTGQHVIDLGCNTLRINTLLYANAHGANLRFRNGRLELRNEVRMNGYYDMWTSLGPDIELDMNAALNIQTIDSTHNETRYASFDLRGVTVATNGIGRRVLTMNGLRVGAEGTTRPYDGRIHLDATTTIDELLVTGNVHFGLSGKQARIGAGSQWRLPEELDLTFGQVSAIQLYVGSLSMNFSTYGRIYAGTGGVLRANASTVFVGHRTDPLGAAVEGYLLLADMERIESFTCAGSIRVGAPTTSGSAIGEMSLPPGDASTVNLTVGSAYTGRGGLTLNGTRLAVSEATTIGANGIVSNRVGAASSGLVLGAAATLDVASGGKIAIVFDGPKPGGSDPYWGLKLAGDQTTTLETLKTAGKLTWNDAAVGGKVQIYAYKGDSYVGIPPPCGTVLMLR